MLFNTNMIREKYNAGEELSFIFFWGHTMKEGGKMTKACLSQWFPCEFVADGVRYHTAEQFMMAQKALLFHDDETFQKIMTADNPKDYKALGREVKGFNETLWDASKFSIVLQGSLAKFSQNPHLLAFLLGTGDSILVEASPYDGIWGVNLRMDDPAIQDPNLWKGENLLGFALMEARERLRCGSGQ